ncbi:MAG: hypothetical protein JWM16_275 [Verrucomicrobiales bacterium]|nr:hypothetical protein [Verrucomicrobiales bacterium]
MPSRRKFLLNCSAFAATAALAPAAALAARPRLRDLGLDSLSPSLLTQHLNSWFVVRDAAGAAVAVQLVAVEVHDREASAPSPLASDSFEKFSVLFAGDVSQPLDQNTYFFEHAGIGRFAMFIVPIGRPDLNRCFYEAVFSRPMPASGHPGRRPADKKTHLTK